MKGRLILLLLLPLAACSPDVPRTFAAPDAERERLEDALDASCTEERRDYWFCTAEGGFFHIFIDRSASEGPMVRTVMLDRNSASELQAEVVELYGFSGEDLSAVMQGASEHAVAGGFVLSLDSTWEEPVIEVYTGDPDSALSSVD